MALSLEERVAYLEGKVEEHSRGFEDIRTAIVLADGHTLALDQKVDRLREDLASRIDSLDDRLSTRTTSLEQSLNSRITSVEQGVNSRITSLEERFNSRFDGLEGKLTWLVGIQVALLLAVIGSLLQL